MSILPLPSGDGKPKPALGVPMLAAGEFPEGLPTFHPQCRIVTLGMLSRRFCLLLKQGKALEARELGGALFKATGLRIEVAMAVGEPIQFPPLGGGL